MSKKYCEACDRNRDPILAVIRVLFSDCRSVLEIGSGTGQHAVYFAKQMPHLVWHTSDLPENLEDIRLWVDDSGLDNLRPPIHLDVTEDTWPEIMVDAVFSANTTHIMHWPAVADFIRGTGRILPIDGKFALYGPFNYGNAYTSQSNADFDAWLKQRDPDSSIRNFEDLDRLANAAGMRLQGDVGMPANNRLLCWIKRA